MADDLAQVTGIPRYRIQVNYNPVVTPELQARANDLLEHLWFESGEPPVMRAVVRLTAQKDFSPLIQAFSQVRRTQPARLLILSEGKSGPSLKR